MSEEGLFFIYCFEIYKAAKGATGKEMYRVFEQYGVDRYLYDCYEALHTTGEQYIINDIDGFITARKREIVSG